MSSPEDYARIESAGSPAFSADGRTLFHTRGAGLQQLWALDLKTGASWQLTDHDEKVGSIRRAPEDDRIAYTIDAGGDERHQVWLWEDGVSRALTAAPEVVHGLGAWSPDGAAVAITANDRDVAHFDVLRLEVATGVAVRLMEGVHEALLGPWGKDGRMVVVQDRATTDQRPFVLDAGSGEAVAVRRAGAARWASLRFDGGGLLGLTDAGGRDCVALCRVDVESGAVTAEYAPEGREVEAWAQSSAGLLATVENDRGASILRVGVRGEERAQALLPTGVVSDLAWSADGRVLAFVLSGHVRPAGLWLWRDGAVEAVWAPECALKLRGFELVQWAGADGRVVPGYFAVPEGAVPEGAMPGGEAPGGMAPGAGWPAVVWVHGGPASQARAAFRADMQALLAQGYAVLLPNVRGSSGYGRAALDADDVERRLDSVSDLAAGRAWLAARAEIDAGRIAVMGQSYGGYMVLAAITEHPGLWRCAIDFYGIADFGTLLEATGSWRRAHRAAEYGDPVRHRALFDRISPIRHIERAEVPLLVLHGVRDPRVAIGESEQVVAAYRALGRAVTYEVFGYAGHGFVRGEDKARAWGAVAAFLRAHL